jgi:16S rRNA processing protein RimM
MASLRKSEGGFFYAGHLSIQILTYANPPFMYIQIGFIKKTHGLKGELKIAVEEPFEDLLFQAERIFIEQKGGKVPYFIESIRGGGELIVKFEDVGNKEAAMPLQSRPVFLPTAEVPEEALLPIDPVTIYAGLEGYALIDQTLGEIGTIESIIATPQQELAVLTYQGREVLAPLNERFVQTIDRDARQVKGDFPEGLFDL